MKSPSDLRYILNQHAHRKAMHRFQEWMENNPTVIEFNSKVYLELESIINHAVYIGIQLGKELKY